MIEMDKASWDAFVNNGPARDADRQRQAELFKKLQEAEDLIKSGWDTDEPWPGIIYNGIITAQIEIETWVLMRAMFFGAGMAAVAIHNTKGN